MPFVFSKCFTQTKTSSKKIFQGLYEIQPKVFSDERGYFFEVFNQNDFNTAGLKLNFVQDNQSYSTQGVLRGLHFQKKYPQGKLVRAISGQIYDIVVDLRNNSETFGLYYSVILDSEKQNQLYIPKGFAHGFFVCSKSAIFTYKCTDFYHPEDEYGIIWNDKTLNIDWKTITNGLSPILSNKDQNYACFNKSVHYF